MIRMSLTKRTYKKRFCLNCGKRFKIREAKVEHTRKFCSKVCADQYRKNYQKNFNPNILKQIEEKIGNFCFICSKTKQLFHEIHGIEHTKNKQYQERLKYILEHVENFEPLCFSCHRLTHNLAKQRKISQSIENLNLSNLEHLVNLLT